MTTTTFAAAPPADTALSGLYVVITRAEEQSSEFARLLQERGAIPIFYPCIDFVPPRNVTPLDNAIQHAAAGKFDWLVVTSTNTVDALAQRLSSAGLDGQALAALRMAAVGPKTAQAVTDQLGLTPEVVPDEFIAPALAKAMSIQLGQRILLPQSALAKPDLAKALTASGAEVTVVTAYRTVPAQGGDDVPTLLWHGKIDAVTFTSGSTIRYFRKRLDMVGANLGMLQDVVVACIGPATAEAAKEYGLRVRVMPAEHTVEGLVGALAGYFGGGS